MIDADQNSGNKFVLLANAETVGGPPAITWRRDYWEEKIGEGAKNEIAPFVSWDLTALKGQLQG